MSAIIAFPLGSLGDPPPQDVDLLRAQAVVGLGRHLQRVVFPRHRAKERTFVRLAGNDGRFAALAPSGGSVQRAKIKFPFQVLGVITVASQAFGRQDSADLGKRHRFGCPRSMKWHRNQNQQGAAKSHVLCPMGEPVSPCEPLDPTSTIVDHELQ
jgi:hypothetical protein